MGTAATKQCFDSILCKNKVKPLNKTLKANNDDDVGGVTSNPINKSEPGSASAMPSFGEVIDFDYHSLKQPLQRIAWDEPKEFVQETVRGIVTEKGEEMVEEIKSSASTRWKSLNLESKRNVPTDVPATPGLLHPDSCLDIDQE